MVSDWDGDAVRMYLALGTTDSNKLDDYGLKWVELQKSIIGKPFKIGVIGLIKIRAEDVHGAYVDLYLTIKVEDYRPNRIKAVKEQLFNKTIQIVEREKFQFVIPDDLFYDP